MFSSTACRNAPEGMSTGVGWTLSSCHMAALLGANWITRLRAKSRSADDNNNAPHPIIEDTHAVPPTQHARNAEAKGSAQLHMHRVRGISGDFTWSSLSGRSVRLAPVAIQSLSELERARLQEVAYTRLHQDYDLGCQITMPKDGQKRKKSLRRKLDSLAKEKSKDKGRPSHSNALGFPNPRGGAR
ncbi:Rho GTPase-activating protein 6 [Liparis tanakae]|uniref:Rho GTPase-activating protein 6 n=1 Tax=Liparis tanakae TaxID=230148 RepID=A0A4Z2FGV8_9TELE|nr:Rho GTPase-activating protein 6 [Liparis tanakae]